MRRNSGPGFDIEWEHVFPRIRFGEHYRHLRADDLDEWRLEFYTLAMRLSPVAGPLRLLDGDFPDRRRDHDVMLADADAACRPYREDGLPGG